MFILGSLERVVDFLLVLIELFFARCYGRGATGFHSPFLKFPRSLAKSSRDNIENPKLTYRKTRLYSNFSRISCLVFFSHVLSRPNQWQ